VALIAGLAIFPIVFAFNLEVSSGAGLFFITLPNAFEAMGGAGPIVGAAFFFLAFFAAITSSVSLLEPSAAFVKERFNMSKAKAAWIMGAVMIAIGLISVFGQTADNPTAALDAIDTFTGQVMLPLAGLLITIFVGWRLDKAIIAEEFAGSESLGRILLVLTRFVAPVFVGIVFLSSVYGAYFSG
jgi:NSS family neurotransmitter:Na+ symporter